MDSISITFRSNRPDRPAVKRIMAEVHNKLAKEGSGIEHVPKDSQSPWLEAEIDDAKGPPNLVKGLIGAMVEARGEDGVELFLRISGTGPKYRLPDEAAEAEAALRSFQWGDETDKQSS